MLHSRHPALFEIRIADGQFGFREILAVRVGVDDGLQSKTADRVAAVLHVVHGLVVKNFVRLDGGAGRGRGMFFAKAARQQRRSECHEANDSSWFQCCFQP